MGFIANDPEPIYDPQNPAEGSIAGDGFYPTTDLARIRDIGRISTIVTDPQLREAAIGGIITVRNQLREWRAAMVAAGRASMATASDEQLDGKPLLELLYDRAVTATVAAELLETRQDVGASKEGRDRAEACEQPAPDWRRIATHAIRDILGVGRTAVELI